MTILLICGIDLWHGRLARELLATEMAALAGSAVS
jgi:hypothetical protein